MTAGRLGPRLFASITSLEPTSLGASALRLLDAGVDGLHVDIADGVFVPDLTYGPRVVSGLRALTDALIDVHMMVSDPERLIVTVVEAGASRVSFHLEATRYPWRVASLARASGVEVGTALNPATPLAPLDPLGAALDFVDVLTTDPDFAGERLLPRIERRIAEARSLLPEELRLEVDGGIDAGNAATLLRGGRGRLRRRARHRPLPRSGRRGGRTAGRARRGGRSGSAPGRQLVELAPHVISPTLLLSLDLGTTNCKAAAFDLGGRLLARVDVGYPSHSPSAEVHEQSPADWLAAAAAALRGLSDRLGPGLADAAGLALSAWGPGLVLVSGSGEVLNERSPTWQDFRSHGHGERLIAEVGADWIGGGMPTTGFAAKLAWAQEVWPEATRRAASRGRRERPAAALADRGGGHRDEQRPLRRLVAGRRLRSHLVEPRAAPTRPRADGGRRAAAGDAGGRLDLPSGLPVVMGLNDGASATLASGCLWSGDGVISLGTNGVLRVVVDERPPTDGCLVMSLFRYPFVESRHVSGGYALLGGDALRWAVEAFAAGAGDGYELSLREAETVGAASDGVLFLPYLAGRGTPSPDPAAAGAFLGLRGGHHRGHLVRATLEGVAFALRDISSAFDELGWPLGRLAITGGGARSELWRAIVSGVFARPVHHAAGDSNLGAAIVLAVALGLHPTFEEAIAAMTTSVTSVPAEGDVAALALGYERFREAAGRLAGWPGGGGRRA